MERKRGQLFVLSGPSGVGKGSVRKLLDNDELNMKVSISCTTRAPREEDEEGVTYYFVTWDDFQRKIENNEFMEHAGYADHAYGTLKKPVEDLLDAGVNVLLEIETNGARQVMEACPDACTIFLLPPSKEELERRIRSRNSENEEEIRKRLDQSVAEMELQNLYKYVVVNDNLENAASRIREIILENGCPREPEDN